MPSPSSLPPGPTSSTQAYRAEPSTILLLISALTTTLLATYAVIYLTRNKQWNRSTTCITMASTIPLALLLDAFAIWQVNSACRAAPPSKPAEKAPEPKTEVPSKPAPVTQIDEPEQDLPDEELTLLSQESVGLYANIPTELPKNTPLANAKVHVLQGYQNRCRNFKAAAQMDFANHFDNNFPRELENWVTFMETLEAAFQLAQTQFQQKQKRFIKSVATPQVSYARERQVQISPPALLMLERNFPDQAALATFFQQFQQFQLKAEKILAWNAQELNQLVKKENHQLVVTTLTEFNNLLDHPIAKNKVVQEILIPYFTNMQSYFSAYGPTISAYMQYEGSSYIHKVDSLAQSIHQKLGIKEEYTSISN